MTAAFNATIAIAERYITSSDGTAVFAQAVGDNRLPTLVFIHGLAMSALVWANILRDTRLLEFFQLVSAAATLYTDDMIKRHVMLKRLRTTCGGTGGVASRTQRMHTALSLLHKTSIP